MEGDEEQANLRRNPREEEEVVYHPQPGPRFVVRRYWRRFVFWPLLVLVLVLAATLPPVLVGRSNTRDEEKERALMELTKAGTGLRNGVYTAFVPAASLALWVSNRPRLQDQIDGRPIEISDSYEDAETHFQIAARNALDLVPQFRRGPIQWIGLAPHGIVSAMFPILSFNDTRPLGTSLFRDPVLRRGVIQTVLRDEFVLDGPLQLPTQKARIVVTRFPIFYEASECSCASSFPTANDVVFRTGKAIGLFQVPGGGGMPPPVNMGGSNVDVPVSSLFTYGKLSDYRDRFNVEEGRRFPTEVVFQTKEDDLPTMFCETANATIGDFSLPSIEWVNMSIEYLPKCRFFWGFASVIFNFDLLLEKGANLIELEEAGYRYRLSKAGFEGERIILSTSPGFTNIHLEPISIEIDLPGQTTWSLCVVPTNGEDWEGNDWKWQLAIAILGSFFLAFVAFVVVFVVAYRNQYLKNIAEEFSHATSDAMALKQRAEASEKAAIENEAVAKKFLSTMSHELRTPLNSILAVSELMVLNDPGQNSPERVPSSSAIPLLRKRSTLSNGDVQSQNQIESPCSSSISSPTRDCELIHDSARFLKQIVDDVLDFNKIEMGCLVISPNRFSPALALHSVARLTLPLIKDPSLYFRLKIDPLTPKAVKTDEQRFKQIIMNLASNAIKFVKEGGLTISLSTVCLSSLPLSIFSSLSPSSRPGAPLISPCDIQNWEARLNKCPQDRLREIVEAHQEGEGEARGLFVYVDVEDTGPGMTTEQQRLLFQRFYQIDPKRDIKAGGSGLGLSICVDLCKVMGGVIWATDPMREEEDNENERRKGGRGTSFRFLLPLLGAEGRVSPDLIESLFVVDGGGRDESLESSFCQIEDSSIEEELLIRGEETETDKGDLSEKIIRENGQEEGRWERESGECMEGIPDFEGSKSALEHKSSSEPIKSSSDFVPFSPPSPSPDESPSPGLLSIESDESPSVSPLPPSSSSPPPPSSPPLSPSSLLRVLLIDDSKLNRLVFVRMIKSLLPCQVDEAENGEEGIERAMEAKERGEDYDLVVCDLNMGDGKNGVEVGEELRKRLECPFVMALFTADVMVELGEGEKGLFEQVLFKPLSRESLIEFLVRFLDKKHFPKDFPPKGKKKRRKGNLSK